MRPLTRHVLLALFPVVLINNTAVGFSLLLGKTPRETVGRVANDQALGKAPGIFPSLRMGLCILLSSTLAEWLIDMKTKVLERRLMHDMRADAGSSTKFHRCGHVPARCT